MKEETTRFEHEKCVECSSPSATLAEGGMYCDGCKKRVTSYDPRPAPGVECGPWIYKVGTNTHVHRIVQTPEAGFQWMRAMAAFQGLKEPTIREVGDDKTLWALDNGGYETLYLQRDIAHAEGCGTLVILNGYCQTWRDRYLRERAAVGAPA